MYVGMHSTAILSEKNTGEFTTSIDLAQCTYLSPSPDIAKPNPAQQTAIRSSTSRAPLVLRRLAPLTAIRKSRANSASAEIAQPIPPQQLPRRQRQSRIPHHRRSPRPFRSQTALKGPEGSNDQLRYRQNCFGGLRPVFLAGCDLQFKNQTHWFAFCEVIQSPFFKAYGGGGPKHVKHVHCRLKRGPYHRTIHVNRRCSTFSAASSFVTTNLRHLQHKNLAT